MTMFLLQRVRLQIRSSVELVMTSLLVVAELTSLMVVTVSIPTHSKVLDLTLQPHLSTRQLAMARSMRPSLTLKTLQVDQVMIR